MAGFGPRPGDCPECGGAGEHVVPVVHGGSHVGDSVTDCGSCFGTGVLHCGHGVPRRDCREPGCAVEEVMES